MKVAKGAVFVVFLSFSIAISGRESEFVAVPIERLPKLWITGR